MTSVPTTDYTAIRPLRMQPAFVSQARALVEPAGGVASAVAHLFKLSNISIRVLGDTSGWSVPGAGTLFVGDHRDGVEFAPLLATLGNLGREDAHFIAKPFSFNARIVRSLGTATDELMLPVIPGTLARDRQHIWNRDFWWRLRLHNRLPTRREIVVSNLDVIERAAHLVGAGHLVNIFPTGGILDARKKPWHRGIGKIIQALPDECIETTRVVLFRFDDISKILLVRSLVRQSHAIPTPPYEITLHIGPQGTLPELFGGVDAVHRLDATELTAQLRDHFLTYFDEEA